MSVPIFNSTELQQQFDKDGYIVVPFLSSEQVEQLTAAVVGALLRRQPHGGTLHIEDIQDQVELSLMRSGEHDVARTYVLYREERTRERAAP